MKIATSLLFLFCCLSGSLWSQFKCGVNDKLQQLYKEDPKFILDQEALLAENYRLEEKGDDTLVIFSIPIVFHVIHYNGSENITDEQIYDQVDILNRDFRLFNQDTALVIAPFKSLYADVGIEFKLANIDPYGNCTNGIEHIYSHETFQGDDYSKLNQWYRSNYLNVWIVDQMENGVAGYAYYPTAVDGSGFWRDGIIILHNYIGSIGTSNLNNSRALTHEIGHYLGLAHPWGSTNNPGVSCGDDGIPDTPVTRGSNLSCNLQLSQCTNGIIENVQNYMDYSYCSVMFTKDQVTAMRNILQGISGNRDQLISDSTAQATGINQVQQVCPPIAYGYASRTIVCPGEPVTFYDRSYNGQVVNRLWYFDDGQANSYTAANPVVTFSTPGYKNIKLVVENSAGSDSVLYSNMILVSPEWPDFVGPATIDFDAYPTLAVLIENPESNFAKFEKTTGVGKDLSKAMKLNNYFNVAGTTPYSASSFYNNRLGGSQDAYITPAFDLNTTTSVEISFDYAYATNAENEADITETLQVLSSRNCGLSWTPRISISGTELLTAGNYGYNPFTPTSNVVWKTASFTYTPNGQDQHTRFKFLFTASDFSNNFYLDNIKVNGILGVGSFDSEALTVYPNPIDLNKSNSIFVTSAQAFTDIVLYNALGQPVKMHVENKDKQSGFEIILESNLASGTYFLKLLTAESVQTIKISILN